MALEGVLEFMTSTGKLTGPRGEKLRAYDLPHIVRAADYTALPNGILPNTVWNWVKNFIDEDKFQVLCGGSWRYYYHDDLRPAYRHSDRPDCGGSGYVGLRVGFFPRTTSEI